MPEAEIKEVECAIMRLVSLLEKKAKRIRIEIELE